MFSPRTSHGLKSLKVGHQQYGVRVGSQEAGAGWGGAMGRDGVGVGAGGAVPRVGDLRFERLLAVAYGVPARAPVAAAGRGVCAPGPPPAHRVLRVQVRRATRGRPACQYPRRLRTAAPACRVFRAASPVFSTLGSPLRCATTTRSPPAAASRHMRATCAPLCTQRALRCAHGSVLAGWAEARSATTGGARAAAPGKQLGGSPGARRLACPAAACFAVVAGDGQRGHDAQSPGACQPAVGGLDRH